MDRKTRVYNAMMGKPVDRIPFSFWYHFTGDHAKGEACVKAHMDYYQRSKVDYMKIMSDGFMGPQAYDVQKVSDWAKIKPLGKNCDYYRGQVERAKRINEELKGDCLTFYNIFAPFTIMRWAGDEMVMAHLREDEQTTRKGLEVITEDVATLVRGLIEEAGCTGIYLSLQAGEKTRFTYDEYRRIVMPSDLTALNAANALSDINIAHLCGWAGDANNLELWRDYPARAFNWAISIDKMSLIEGREFFGGKTTVIGGFDNRKEALLYKNGTKEEIKAFAKKIVLDYEAACGTRDGLIIGADCTIWFDVDDTRFAWVLEALEEIWPAGKIWYCPRGGVRIQ